MTVQVVLSVPYHEMIIILMYDYRINIKVFFDKSTGRYFSLIMLSNGRIWRCIMTEH